MSSDPAAAASSAVGSKRSRDDANAAASVGRRVQARHFHAGPHPQQDSQQPEDDMQSEPEGTAAAAAPLPLAARLYRDALGSVFKFYKLSELATLLVVSREWQAAVLNMKALQFDQSDVSTPDELATICASRLRRHVFRIGRWRDNDALNLIVHPTLLMLLADRMPRLGQLYVSVEPSSLPMHFPAGLSGLDIGLLATEAQIAAAHAERQFASTMLAVSRLQNLESLTIVTGCWKSDWSLAPLTQLTRLNIFELVSSNSSNALQLSDAQVASIRMLPDLNLIQIHVLDSHVFARLLAQPHQLRWKELVGFRNLSAEMAELLVQLPLTRLYVKYHSMPHADFLTQLPQLTDLTLGSSGEIAHDVPRIFNTLAACTQLQTLTICNDDGPNAIHFTSAHLSSCLPQLTALHTLHLLWCAHLTTLPFLAEGTLPQTLTSLHLCDFRRRLPVAEVKHVLALRKLRSLKLENVFVTPLDAAGLLLFQPPIQQLNMPELTSFKHEFIELVWAEENEAEEDDDGAGV